MVDKWLENFNKYSSATPLHHVQPPPAPRILKKVVVANSQNLFATYEQEIGIITPLIADSIDDWSKSVPEEWVISSMKEAAQQNKRNWKYCTAILTRWKNQGFKDEGKKSIQTEDKSHAL